MATTENAAVNEKKKKNPIPMHSLPSPTILDNGRRKHLNGKNCTDGHSKSTLIKWNKEVLSFLSSD